MADLPRLPLGNDSYPWVGKLYPDRAPGYDQRPLSDLTHIIIHHTASADNQMTEAEEVATLAAIRGHHQAAEGWPGIGYHAVVFPSGRLYLTGKSTDIRYHAGDANPYSYGLCVAGSFMGKTPTVSALAAMRTFIANMRVGFGRDFTIVGHKDVMQTACPGDTWEKWKPVIVGGAPLPQPPADDAEDWDTAINVTRGFGREFSTAWDRMTLKQAVDRMQEAGKQLTDVAVILERLRANGP